MKALFSSSHAYIAVGFFVGLLGLSADSFATQPYSLPQYLAPTLQQERLRYESTEVDPSDIAPYYAANGYAPIWVNGAFLNTRAMQALEVIGRAEEHGIFYADYGLDAIRHISRFEPRSTEEATQVALSLEILMSNAVYHYARDLSGEGARDRWNVTATAPTVDAVSLLSNIAATRNIAPIMASLAPHDKDYVNMQHMLQRYEILANQGGWKPWVKGETLKPGAADARISTLVSILKTTGDLSSGYTAIAGHENIYTPTIVDAVKSFQERHAIENDGVLGEKTQQALATPINTRIAQIAATMVRMRAMPRNDEGRHILVNIPGYYLQGYEGEKKSLEMRVIVGKPVTRTPMFSNIVTDVVFNPTWTPPQSIVSKEMMPKLRSNPSYFRRANFTVMQTVGGVTSEVDPLSIDYANAGFDGARYSFRQAAGSGNALGKIKFNIPNSDSIYLHSTAQPHLFEKQERALSHGCIRLHDPRALARFVLQADGWETAKIDSTYDSSASRSVKVNPVPVHLVYWTSWVDDKGRARFHPDIYGIDKPIVAAMAPAITDDTVKLAMNQ
ncbi:MAG: hypothetical protein C0436_04245 [Alphaproteobacteria bacterium]|nr:hypothetical protein [Alphaproteobacteria bacterium]